MPDFRRKRGSGQGLFLHPLALRPRGGYPKLETVKPTIQYMEREPMNGTCRNQIKTGQQVLIVLKKDQQTGKLTHGIVKDILTKSPTHPHGIKVRLESGAVGRVKQIL
jgi:uncharacterized repeat protein (TIGR03833 family)